MREKRKYQASKSTSNKRPERRRDILSGLPHSEFLGIASTFSGLVLSLLLGLFGVANTYAESQITISLNGSVDLNIMGGDPNGVFGKSTEATASVTTTNYTGYQLTMTGNSASNALVGKNDENHTLPSIREILTEQQFNNATYNNSWGFRPSKLNSATNTSYHPAPKLSEYMTIDVTDTANPNTANEYTLAVAARVDKNTPNDSYTGSFTLAATGNATAYYIAYADLSATVPAQQANTTTGNSVTLSTEYPSRYGYTFVGWCTAATTDDSCSGEVKQPGGTYTLNPETDNAVTLYAMWKPNYGTFDAAFKNASVAKVNGYYPMQSMTTDICAAVTIGTTGTLIDTRDNRTYEVIKYADNNCWMHQNLELTFYTGTDGKGYAGNALTKAGSVASGVTTLNNTNTDINNGTSYNINTFYATQNKAATTSGDPNFAWADDGSDGGHSFSWPAYNPAEAYAIPTGTQNEYGQNEYTTSANGTPSQRGGNLYNWTMATLGSGTSLTQDGQTAQNSICPKGWKLPDNSGSKSFYNLLDAYYTGTIGAGSPQTTPAIRDQQNLMRSDPLDFVVSGCYNKFQGYIDGRTTEGAFWSDTAGSATFAHYLRSYYVEFNPQFASNRGYGRAVRCVAR